jgi:RNA polymerase sigma factor (sigma-70 family)
MASTFHFLHSDARILDLMRRGDEEALVILFDASRRAVTSYVRNNNGTTDDAEDMLQEALIVLWEKVRSGNFHYDAKLSTFIVAVVKNLWLRRLARQRKESPDPLEFDRRATTDPSPLDELIENDRAKQVRDALEKLGDPCRKLLLLFYWDEYSLEDIAAAMGFANAETVKSKKYQCKKALEQYLTKE